MSLTRVSTTLTGSSCESAYDSLPFGTHRDADLISLPLPYEDSSQDPAQVAEQTKVKALLMTPQRLFCLRNNRESCSRLVAPPLKRRKFATQEVSYCTSMRAQSILAKLDSGRSLVKLPQVDSPHYVDKVIHWFKESP